MLKRIVGTLAILSTLAVTGCSEVVDPGHVGVVVKNPYTFGSSGVMPDAVVEGRHFVAPTTTIIPYNTQPIQKDETFNDMVTSTRTPVDFKAIIRYEIIPEKAPILHSKFGVDFYRVNIQRDFQNKLRDFAQRHTIQELTTDPDVSNKGEETVFNAMKSLIKEREIPIRVLAVTIGAIAPPEEVLIETARTEAQNQRSLTEDARANAELNRLQAEKNKALADKAYMKEMNMSPSEYLQSRQIEINKEMIDVVKNKPNVNILFTMGSSPNVTVPQPVKP